MIDRVKKSFLNTLENKKLYKKGDLHESKDSKRRSFLIESGYLEEPKEEVEKESKTLAVKKGKTSKKAGE